MKKLILVFITIFFINIASAQETRVSVSASVGTPHDGITSVNDDPLACASILLHGGAGIGVFGLGFEYNNGFKNKYKDTTEYINMPFAQFMFGFVVPNTLNPYLSGTGVLFNVGCGFKSFSNMYPNIPLKAGVSLQICANYPQMFADNLQAGIFVRGTLGTHVFKNLNIDPPKNLKNNYGGYLEAGLRALINQKDSKKRRYK